MVEIVMDDISRKCTVRLEGYMSIWFRKELCFVKANIDTFVTNNICIPGLENVNEYSFIGTES